MSRVEYSTIQVPKVTKQKIEDFRRKHGYPSNSQAVTALVERGDVSDDIKASLVDELRKTIAKEAISIAMKEMSQLLLKVIRHANKPISELSIDDVVRIMENIESK